MKLLIIIIQDDDASFLMDSLMDEDYRFTKLSSTGGFLKKGNTTLLLGVDDDKVDDALSIVEDNCKQRSSMKVIPNPSASNAYSASVPVEVNTGGAIVFVLDIDQYVKI